MRSLVANLDLNVSAIAKDLGVSNTNMWFYFQGHRKWNLETWLDALAALGYLKVTPERIIIDIPLSTEDMIHFKRLRKNMRKYVIKPDR